MLRPALLLLRMPLEHEVPLPLIQQALSSLNDVVLITEAEPFNLPGPRIVWVNPAFERMSGYSASEVIGKTPRLLQGPRTSRAELDRLRRALEQWEPCRVTVTNYRKDRRPFDVEFEVVPVADERGWFTHCVSVQRDTTMQSVAAPTIAHADTVDALVSGVLREIVEYADVDGACWELREGVQDDWAVTHAVVRDRVTNRYAHGNDDVPADMATRVAQQESSVTVAALAMRGETGARLVLWNHTGAVSAHAASLAEAVAGRSTISYERLRADAARGALELRLRQAQTLESIGRLAGGVAHDFNNLLTVIVGNLEFLKDRIGSDQSAHDEMADVMRATDRARSLVQHLLAFSRQQPITLGVLDLRGLILDTVVLLQRALGSHVSLATNIPEGLPLVVGDAALLEQVLINLAVNARDAMQAAHTDPLARMQGCINIRVHAVERRAGARDEWERLALGHYLCISVEDDGPGMPPEVLARAFDPFFTTKPVGSGTGLGLSSVYGAVAQMGGAVRLSEAATRGLLARIMLPVSQPAP